MTLQSISVTPGSVALERDEEIVVTATGNYSDGSARDLSLSVTWQSSNPLVATVVTVTGQAVLVALDEGQAVITAIRDSLVSNSLSASVSTTVPPPPPPEPIPALPHQADFLSAGFPTHLYVSASPSERAAMLQSHVDRGYTHFYVYVYNENDYGGPAFDYYSNPQGFLVFLEEIWAAGLAPVVWLVPDNAPVMRARSNAEVHALFDALLIDTGVDDLVSSYCLGLELDEYWSSLRVNNIGSHLRTLTNKPIAVHQTPGLYGYANFGWCDYMILQYGFGQTEQFVADLTRQAIADLSPKAVVAGEYWGVDEGVDGGTHLGDAGVAAGASGFGNGGTAF